MMKVTTFAMMAGVVLALGMLPSESEAYCPCAGTPGDQTGICAVGSNIPKGPNGCTDDPTGLLPPNTTDGKGCIEIHTENPSAGDCEACIGGSVFGGTGTIPPNINDGVQGCTCVMTTDDPLDYACICVDTTVVPPVKVPCTPNECEDYSARGC